MDRGPPRPADAASPDPGRLTDAEIYAMVDSLGDVGAALNRQTPTRFARPTCGLCGRRMEAHWVNDRAGYRCRHGYNSARGTIPDRPRNLYVCEDTLIAELVRHVVVLGEDRSEGLLDVAAYLRSRDMVVVHDRAGWSLVAGDEF